MEWKHAIFSKDGVVDLLTLEVLLGMEQSLNGNSPFFLRDLGMYLRTMGANLVEVAIFLSTHLIEEDVFPCLLSSFFSCCLGMFSLGIYMAFFMPPLPVEVMVNSMVSLEVSFSSMNPVSMK